MTSEQALIAIENAKQASALFPDSKTAAATYKKLLTLVHPDRFPADQRPRAAAAAGKLAELYSQVHGKPATPAVIGPWVVEGPLAKGDLADLYLVESMAPAEARGGMPGVLKIARSASDNDLMDTESRALTALWKAEPANFHKYLPKLLATFQASGRRVNVLDRHPGYLSLRQIGEQLPTGVPFRHIVWMMNRLLSLIGFLQRAGYVHGGITPDHLLYHPETHGLVLVGWCSAVPAGETIKIASKTWLGERFYAPEVQGKRPATGATDIFMASQSMLFAGLVVPERFHRLFEWCTAASPAARPQDAVDLQEMWTRLAEQEYGKPTYVKLDLPVQ